MVANELRIGNFVNCPREYQNPFRIDLMEYAYNGYAKVGMKVNNLGLITFHPLTWELKDLSPIPLTEEILLKCGFVYRIAGAGGQDEWSGMGYWSLLGFHLIGTKSGRVWFERNRDWEIKYLHQLQNLYFSLTGQELEVSL